MQMNTLNFKDIKQTLSKYELFILVFVLFLPEYLFYPSIIVVGLYVIYRFFQKKLLKMSMVWVLLLYIFAVTYFNHNTDGLVAGLYVIFLVMYGTYLHSIMSPHRYMQVQFYIVWSSLFNFFFNFINYKPFFANSVMEVVKLVIPLEGLPPLGQGSFRAFSTFGNPNLYAFVLMIVLLVCFNQLQLQWTFKNYSLVLFYLGAFILNIYCLFLTGTRSILPALGIGLMTIVIVQRKWMQLKFILLLGTGTLIFILLKPSIFPRFFEVIEHSQIRLDIWERAISVIRKDPWWGKGLLGYGFMFTDAPDSHNIFFESLISFGIIGSTLLVGFFLERLNYLLKYASHLDYPLALAVLVSTIFYGIFDIPLFAIQPSLVFVLVMSVPLRNKYSTV